MLKKNHLFLLLLLMGFFSNAQEKKILFKEASSYLSFQFIDREIDPYKITSFSLDAQSAPLLDRYDISKFSLVTQVKLNFASGDSLLPEVIKKLSLLPSLTAIEFAEYPIFPPRDRSKFNQKKFPEEIKLLKKLRAVNCVFFKYYNWDDVLTKLAYLPELEQLDITLSYFDQLPNALRKLNKLVALSINDNEYITSLPSWVTEFKKLSYLQLYQMPKLDFTNAFTLLGEMPNIRSLDFGNNRFDNVPTSLANMRSLQSVSAPFIKVGNWENFFGTLSALPELKELSIRGTDSMVLPKNIGDLKKLEKLVLDKRKLVALPEEIGQLKELKILSVSENHLRELPTSFYQLTLLQYLDLSYNQLHSIPEAIGNLRDLEYLNLSKTEIDAIPSSVGNLKKCKKLLLNNNLIAELPETIAGMSALEELSVSSNKLSTLFADFSKLLELRKIEASQNSISTIDPSIGLLVKLEALSLNNNLLQSLPNSICSLINLKELFISANVLRALPDDMGNLVHLESLDISSGRTNSQGYFGNTTGRTNSFRYLPSSLSRLQELHTLWLSNNTSMEGDSAVRVVLRMGSKMERLDMSACNISSLPANGWENRVIRVLDLRNNHIHELPIGLIYAPEVKYLQLSNNPAGIISKDYNSKEQLMILAVQNGLIGSYSLLPQTAEMCKALNQEATTHAIYKRYTQALALFELADSICGADEKRILDRGTFGSTQFVLGQYVKAIVNLSAGLRRDTAQMMRIMNFIDPEFKNLAESYVLLKDTVSAIDTYIKWARFSQQPDALSNAALLLQLTGNKKESIDLFLESANQYRNGRDKSALSLLSILEIFVVAGISDSVKNFPSTITMSTFDKEHILLMEYLLLVNGIIHSDNTMVNEFLTKIEDFVEKKTGWSYDFIESWLNKVSMSNDQRSLIWRLTAAIKAKIHS